MGIVHRDIKAEPREFIKPHSLEAGFRVLYTYEIGMSKAALSVYEQPCQGSGLAEERKLSMVFSVLSS